MANHAQSFKNNQYYGTRLMLELHNTDYC